MEKTERNKNISLGPVKTLSSSKCHESPEKTTGNKPKTNLVSNTSLFNFPCTGTLNKLMKQRGSNHPWAFKLFHFAPQL